MSNGTTPAPRSFRSLGFAPLYLVEQELLRYEAGDIAHIENALKGEHRTRDHRRLKRTEETITIETETTEETEKDLQSTDRFELEKESTESQKEESSLDVSVTVKYGGFVDVEASTKYAQTNASEQSDRAATNYAREVMERTASRIQERVREERIRTTIEEFEEKNLHTIDNIGANAEHVVGIYRWADKCYRAQLFDYGWRLLFEFMVPEPAAFLRYAQDEHPPEGEELVKPAPPLAMYMSSEGPVRVPWLVGPQDIDVSNYCYYVQQYQVPDVTPPPEKEIWRAYTFKATEAKTNNQQSRESQTKSIPIPDGYRAISARVTVAHAPHQLKSEQYVSGIATVTSVTIPKYNSWEYVAVTVGNSPALYFNPASVRTETVDLSWWKGPWGHWTQQGQTGELGLLIDATWDTNWAVSIEIRFERTEEGLTKWRFRTYDAIMQRYFALKAEYEEQLAARGAQQGVAISGRNPEMNRAIEKGELKRGALTLLTEKKHPQLADFGSIQKTDFPEIDFGKAGVQAGEIQFLEQAFEWSYMMYSLYPYYWADQQSWPILAQIEDTDPLHVEFLQAGAARVVVPVRRGYEKWIIEYLSTGDPYGGKGRPDAVAPEFVDIYDEIREKQGYDGQDRNATLTVIGGSTRVQASAPVFVKPAVGRLPAEHDENRRIYIGMKPYRIAKVVSEAEVILAEAYEEEGLAERRPHEGLPFALGARYVGEPWLVKVPTSLVILEKTDQLAGLKFGES